MRAWTYAMSASLINSDNLSSAGVEALHKFLAGDKLSIDEILKLCDSHYNLKLEVDQLDLDYLCL